MKRIVRNIGLAVAVITLFMTGLTVTRSVHADSPYWTRRVGRVARQRSVYRYPSINWNARDLGGYYAGRGYWTRPDKVFRGGYLRYIGKTGAGQMKALNINEVIDLRSHRRQGGNDPQEPSRNNRLGVVYKDYPVNTYRQKINLKYAKAHYGGEIYKYGAPFTTYRTARQAYRDIFDQLLRHKNGAIYFHCLEGRDRTGLVSALYLSALGVSRYNIYNDFLETDYYRHKYTYRNQTAELNHFFNTIKAYYGNVHNYLRRGLGLSNHQIHQLRRNYLVKK